MNAAAKAANLAGQRYLKRVAKVLVREWVAVEAGHCSAEWTASRRFRPGPSNVLVVLVIFTPESRVKWL